jgi:SAM-dependent methyltransferase
MTGFEGRFVREGPFFKDLIKHHCIGTALDAGCGTGFHSILLSRLGVKVTAVDLSGAMLARLLNHAASEHLPITTCRSSFQELHLNISATFDGIFCMGNALAHLLTADDLRQTIHNFSSLLNPRSILVLQVLNFERVLALKPRTLSVKADGETVFTRYYEYEDPFIRFNIAKSTGENAMSDAVITTTLRPVVWNELSMVLGEAGFEHIRSFGAISMTEYDAATSQDLVVMASRKPL